MPDRTLAMLEHHNGRNRSRWYDLAGSEKYEFGLIWADLADSTPAQFTELIGGCMQAQTEVVLLCSADIILEKGYATYLTDLAMETEGLIGCVVPGTVPLCLNDGKDHEWGSDELIKCEEGQYPGSGVLAIPSYTFFDINRWLKAAGEEANKLDKQFQLRGEIPVVGTSPALPMMLGSDYLDEWRAIVHRSRCAGRDVYCSMYPGIGRITPTVARPM